MRYIKIEDAKSGMCLAYNMYDTDGHTLICSGSVLSEFYIRRLNDYGFDGVYIADELSQDIEIEPIITPELRAEGLVGVRESNIDSCKNVAKKIVDQVLDKDILSLDLTDLRSFDSYTYAHSVNVAVIACVIGFGLSLNSEELEQIVMAGLLHDLGKLVIPREILNKPARLTSEEYDIMKTHSTLSYELIKERWDISANVKAAVLYHHENVDGSGYPDGREGDQTSLFTKVLHVADVYDALVSKRPYKNPYSPYEACEYLMGAGGIMFDTKVVEALMLCVPFYPKGTQVKLSDNREGIIVENSGTRNLRPLIRLLDGTMLDLQEHENFKITILHETNETVLDPIAGEADRKKMLTPSRRCRIMVIDSMLIHLQTMRGLLHNMYDLQLFTSFEQALLHLKRQTEPDLIILDMDMPRISGFDAAEKIQGIVGDFVPMLFVINTNDKSVVARCRKAGAAGYIVRPYKPTFVKAEIKRILMRQQVTH
ncbi:MAG: HD domain-containing protein [Lachnospiraceae bacterium]|nr:HD domain-containing protein [Lachnospiraceae bacterium]